MGWLLVVGLPFLVYPGGTASHPDQKTNTKNNYTFS